MRSLKAFKAISHQLGGALTGLALSLTPALADQIEGVYFTALTTALTDQVIVPAYKDLLDETADLSTSLRSYCAAHSDSNADDVRGHFHLTMDAWQRAQPIQFGPIIDAPGPARFQFWPDKRGTGQRQLRQILTTQDQSVLDADTLASKSVALTDLQALEYILFESPDIVTEDDFKCRYARAIAGHQHELAADLLQAWSAPDGYRTQVLNAAEGTDAFFDEREAASAFLNSMAGAIDVVRLQKLDRPMGLVITDARPKRTESWRSARSLRNIRLNLETVQRFLTVKNGFSDLLVTTGKDTTAKATNDLLSDILSDLEAFDQPLSSLVTDGNARAELESLLSKLRSLQSLVREQMAQDLTLVPGFNATDGD